MIKFRYELNDQLAALVRTNISGVINPKILFGYVDEAKLNTSTSLYANSLYLTCSCLFDSGDDTPRGYENPIVVVARNESEAVAVYRDVMNTDTGTVMCEIERHCDKLEVEPV